MSRCFKIVAILLVFTLLFELVSPSAVMAMDNGKFTSSEMQTKLETPDQPDPIGDETDNPTPVPSPTEPDQPDQPTEDPVPEEPVQTDGLETLDGEYLIPITMEQFEEILKIQPEDDIADNIEAYIERIYNDDGTITENFFFEPIKYKDGNGEWQEINPVIKKETSFTGETKYISDESEVRLEFAENTDGSTLVKAQKGKHSISLQPVENNKKSTSKKRSVKFLDKSETRRGKGQDNSGEAWNQSSKNTNNGNTLKNAEETPIKEDIAFTEESYDAIKYEEIFDASTNIILQPSSGGLKEDIILNEYTGQEVYSFELKLDNLYPVQRSDNNVYLLDKKTNEIIAIIPAPWMTDSAEAEEMKEADVPEEVYDIEVRIRKKDDSTYIYELIPSQDWLGDPQRVYPVTIDPTTSFNTGIVTSYNDSSQSGSSFPNDALLKMGRQDVTKNMTHRNYFDLTTLINNMGRGYQIQSAELVLYQDFVGNSTPTFMLYTFATDYNVSTITWDKKPGLGTLVKSVLLSKATGWFSWEMTDTFTNWYNNPGAYVKKLQMMLDNEGTKQYKKFRSSVHADMESRPRVVVTYYPVTPPAVEYVSVSHASVNGTGWTHWGYPVILSWSGASGGSNGATINQIQYSTNGYDFRDTGSTSPSGSMMIDVPDGQSYVWVRVVNNAGVAGPAKQSNTYYSKDSSAPYTVASVSLGIIDRQNKKLPFSFNGTTDLPAGSPGVKEYYAKLWRYDNAWVQVGTAKTITHTGTGLYSDSFILDPNDSNKLFRISIQAVDFLGNQNVTGTYSSDVNVGNLKTPNVPTLLLPNVNTAQNGIKITNIAPKIAWTLNCDPASDFTNAPTLSCLKYRIDNNDVSSYNTGSWTTVSNIMGDYWNNNCFIDQTVWNSLSEGQHTIYMRAKNNTGIIGDAGSITFIKDTVKPVAALNGSYSFTLDSMMDLIGSATDTYFAGWKLEYKEGGASSNNIYKTLEEYTLDANNLYGNNFKIHELNPYIFRNNTTYTLRFTATDMAGNVSEPAIREFVVMLDGVTTEKGLMTNCPTETVKTPDYTFTYGRLNGGGNAGLIGELYIDGVKVPENMREMSGQDFIAKLLQMGFSESSEHWYFIKAIDQNNQTYYSQDTYSLTQYMDHFTNNSLIEEMQNVKITSSTIKLDQSGTGYFISKANTAPGKIHQIKLTAQAIGTGISYYARINPDQPWQSITSGQWATLEFDGDELQIKVEFANGSTAELDALTAETICVNSLDKFMFKLIEEPTSVTAFANVNYSIKLRWTASETEDVTYNVYRDTNPDFIPSESNLIKEGINENYYIDYEFGKDKDQQENYYKVLAVKTFGEQTVNSIPGISVEGDVVHATMVDSNELQKHLGLQDYWTYYPVQIGDSQANINVSTGNICYQSVDFMNSAPLLALVMTRTYNSQATSDSPLGKKWDFNFNTCLLKEYNAEGEEIGVILKDGDGTLHRFIKDTDGTYKRPDGIYISIVINDEGLYEVNRDDGITYKFNKFMQLVAFSELNGNELCLEYDVRGNLIKVYHNYLNNKQWITFGYELGAGTNDKLMTVTCYYSPSDIQVFYMEYFDDVDGGLLKSSLTTNDVPLNNSQQNIWQEYKYKDSLNNDVFEVQLPSNSGIHENVTRISLNSDMGAAQITDAIGQVTNVTYENTTSAVNGVSVKKSAFEFKPKPNVSFGTMTYFYAHLNNDVIMKLTDTSGKETFYEYPADQCPDPYKPVKIWTYQDHAKQKKQEYTYSYTYNYTNDTRTETATDPLGNVSTSVYKNSLNRLLETTVPAHSGTAKTTYTYDVYGNVLTTTEPDGKVTSNEYYTADQSTTQNPYGGKGWLKRTYTAWNGAETRYEYDSLGRVANVNNKVSTGYAEEQYDYNARNYVIKTTDPLGRVTEDTYDSLGRQVKTRYSLNSNVLSDSTATVEKSGYNANGLLIWQETSAGNKIERTEYEYDELGNELRSIQNFSKESNLPTEVEVAKDTEDYVKLDGIWHLMITSTYTSTGSGQSSDPSITYDFTDAAGRNTASFDGSVWSKSEYDAAGNVVKSYITHYTLANGEYIEDTSARVQFSETDYDILNRAVETRVPDDDGKKMTNKTVYDKAGNAIKTIDGKENVIEYEFDKMGRTTKVIQRMENESHITQYGYNLPVTDAEDQKIAADYGAKYLNTVTDASGKVSKTYYDCVGREIISRDLGSNSFMRYEYDKAGNVSKEILVSNYTGTTATDELKVRYQYIGRDYLVERKDYGDVVTPDMGHTFTGLTNGTSYGFRVRAVNAAGNGEDTSVTAIPRTTPSAPQNFTATSEDRQVTLAWSAPSSNGGSTITSYQVSSNNGGTWVTSSSSTGHTFTGLTNGTQYIFKVRAVNAAGNGMEATASATPVSTAIKLTLNTPATVTITSGGRREVQFTASSAGTYVFESSDRGSLDPKAYTGSSGSAYLDDDSGADGRNYKFQQTLTAGQTFIFYSGIYGDSTTANGSYKLTVLMITAPSAPQNFTATPGSGQVTLSWSVPSSNGGSAITGYQVSSNSGSTWVTASSSTGHTFTGLTDGTQYTFKVRAVNAVGNGAEATATATTVSQYPESAHPYAHSLTISSSGNLQTYTYPGSAESLKVTFSSDTKVENSFDKIYVTDANGTNISGSPFTNTALAGVTVTVPGNTVKIYITSDGSVNYYGYKVTNIETVVSQYPESTHPYAHNLTINSPDNLQTYTYQGSAESLKVTFSSDTKMENSFDKIYITDGNGTNISGSPFTNTALAGVTVTVPGNTVKIYITSDFSVNYYGYKVTNIQAVTEIAMAESQNFTTYGNGMETLGWSTPSGDSRNTFTGLTNEASYALLGVSTVNAAGNSVETTVMAASTGIPSIPQNLTATPGDGQVTLSWSAPLSNGGSAITGYQVSKDNGATWVDISATARANYTEFTYDVHGQRTEMQDYSSGNQTYTTWGYDLKGRITQYVQDGLEVSYSYYDDDKVYTLGYHDRLIKYEYINDNLSAVYWGTKLVESYTYDPITNALEKSTEYLEFKSPTVQSGQGPKIVKTYEYSASGLNTGVTYNYYSSPAAPPKIVEEYTLEYNEKGAIIKETNKKNYSSETVEESTYRYDEKDQLVYSATKLILNGTPDTLTETTYEYDAAGNRTNQTVITTDLKPAVPEITDEEELEYDYNEDYDLIGIEDGDGNSYFEFFYDDAGNMVKEIEYDKQTGAVVQTTEYVYDGMNELIDVVVTQGSTRVLETANVFNGQGKRVQRTDTLKGTNTVVDTTKYYYLDDDSLLFTTNENNQLQSGLEYILSPNGEIIAVTQTDNAGAYGFMHTDIRGSVTNITGYANGNIDLLQESEYDEYGNTTDRSTSKIKNEVKYTGAIQDKASGLYYMNARHYNPQIGRFMQRDTYKGEIGNPLSNNGYTYCWNNPINMVDPTGHKPIPVPFNIRIDGSIPRIFDNMDFFVMLCKMYNHVEFGKYKDDIKGKHQNNLNPVFLTRLIYFSMCELKGKEKLNISWGYRTYGEQAAQYHEYKVHKKNKAASPGNGWHEFGLAVDVTTAKIKKMKSSSLKKYGLHKPVSGENWHIEPIETKGVSSKNKGRAKFAGKNNWGVEDYSQTNPKEYMKCKFCSKKFCNDGSTIK